MATIRTKLMVGIFVIIGFATATAAIIWLGMSNYFEKGLYYVAYFDESVQGLDKDSPVKYLGVPIGRVESIKVAPDATLIEVVMKIEEGLKPEEHLEEVVAQLKSVGITGIMFVEIERKQPYEPDLSPQINFPAKYPVVATKSSEIKQLIKGIDDVINKVKALDLISISTKLKSALDTINQGVNELQLKGVSSDIRFSLAKVNKVMDSVARTSSSFAQTSSSFDMLAANANDTVSSVNGFLTDNKKELTETISEFRHTLETADRLVANGAALVENTDDRLYSVQQQLNISLQNLENATAQLNDLIGRISDQPSQLILGEPPPARTVEPD
ncbi:MAG: MCE family protein, partial [Deltaproteobacteria bacterium]|nr:MCE family protein [Deltaproteobacteria bacterium]